MLSDLKFLDPGQKWPPKSEIPRLRMYDQNEQLFLTEHDKVWGEDFKKMAALFQKKNASVETIINYQQLISKKTADFVCGEPPTIESEGNTDSLSELQDRLNFSAKLYEGFLDVSRYGNGLFKFFEKGISNASPKIWFPTVNPDDIKTITHHVFAYAKTPDTDGEMTEFYVEIHTPGKIEQRWHLYDGKSEKIGEAQKAPLISNSPIKDDFAVRVLTNLTHSGSIFGLDDYKIINSIQKRLMWRIHCIDGVLDKHSEPSLSGPESALQQDPRTGLWFVPLGNYFIQPNDNQKDMKYLTWDGNLEAAWKEIDMLLNQLYVLTEMGQAFIEGGGNGTAESGSALKLRMVSPRIKAKRLVNLNKGTVKILLADLAKLNDIDVTYKQLNITWNDGIPDDEVEETNRLVSATGNKPIMSQYAAMKRRGLSDSEVEAELEQIRRENAADTPYTVGMNDANTDIP